MTPRTKTDYIIIHCSATPPTMDIGAKEIDRWHRERGFLKIGYHFVIRRNGSVEKGREVNEVGAHAKPWNNRSIGVCLVGGIKGGDRQDRSFTNPENNFTDAQWNRLRALLGVLKADYPDAETIGHRDVPGVAKACPSFDVGQWLQSLIK